MGCSAADSAAGARTLGGARAGRGRPSKSTERNCGGPGGVPIPAKLLCQKSHEDSPERVEGEEPRSEPQGGQKCGAGGFL